MYRRNRRRAGREILKKPNSSCSVATENLIDHFFNEQPKPYDEEVYKNGNSVP